MEIPSGFRAIDTYTFYDEYTDNRVLYLKEDRTIEGNDENKIVLYGEKNSEYLTFEGPRYFDGLDLATKLIRFHWYNEENRESGGSYAGAVNGCCGKDKIRFGWIIDSDVTSLVGPVVFQIEAIGENEKNDTYIFKSRYGHLEVLESMETGAGIEDPTEEWYAEFVGNMQNFVNQAAGYRDEAKEMALDAWTRKDDVTGKRYRLGIAKGVPYFEEIAESEEGAMV